MAPTHKIANPIRTIFRQFINFLSRQSSLPHIHPVHLTNEALFLLKSSAIVILILTKNNNAITGDHFICQKIAATL